MVDRGAVPEDQAALLQPLHALVHGAGGQSGRLAEVGVGHAAVFSKQAKDLAVRLLHGGEPRGSPTPTALPRLHPETAPRTCSSMACSRSLTCSAPNPRKPPSFAASAAACAVARSHCPKAVA